MREETTMKRVQDLQEHSKENESEYWIRNQIGDKKLEDEYLLGDIIGRGASSVVYKCLRKGRTEWACKIVKKSLLNKKSVQRDISLLMKLKHPNIVHLQEVFETPDEIQFILELAEGGELFEKIVERGHYSEEDAAQSVRHILNALQYLHSRDIIHTDLKPENLLYQAEADDSILKLADFGMSRLLSDEHFNSTISCGTYGHLAPELLLHKEFDSSTDLWSVGVVTYIMLSGNEPFLDESLEKPMDKRIVEGDFSFPSPFWDTVSDSAKELITKLLSVDPKSRPTAEEALNHPWILGLSTSSLHMNDTILRLRELNARRRFRVATKAVLATRRALNLLPTKNKKKDGKTGLQCLCNSKADGRGCGNECENSERCEHIQCTPVEDSLDHSSVNLNSFQSSPVDGKGIEKPPTCLTKDLSTKYKEGCVGLR